MNGTKHGTEATGVANYELRITNDEIDGVVGNGRLSHAVL